jgi:hypothetical protein
MNQKIQTYIVIGLFTSLLSLIGLAAKNEKFLESQAFTGSFGTIVGGLVGVLTPKNDDSI